ncbi:MAG: RNA polymerase sigma factor [Planctomycetota bacterium]|nr:RNA polymerase sigma factor [Planctomycetota bacterium]
MKSDPDVSAAIQGDRDAFTRLYRRYARSVFLDLVARLRTRQDAEDALQAAFVSAWRHLPRLTNPSRFVPWLFRIARNKAKDLLRKERLKPHRLHDPDLIAPSRPDRPDLARIRDLVAKLQPKNRAIVMLRAVEGWSAADVALAQGLSVATVRRRYARALEHLRTGLARRTNDEDEEKRPRPRNAAGFSL